MIICAVNIFKSILCLVLGFRGDITIVPFLMKEVEHFECLYPDKSYNQGIDCVIRNEGKVWLRFIYAARIIIDTVHSTG